MLAALDGLVGYAVLAAATFGLPVLFVLFVLKGALIGTVLPTSVLLPGYVLAVGATYRYALVVALAVTFAHILGQLVVYLGVRRYGEPALSVVPYVDIGTGGGFDRLDRWFASHGGLAVFVTNIIPWTRGLVAVPAAMSDYPVGRFVAHTTGATLIYHAIYALAPLVGLGLLY